MNPAKRPFKKESTAEVPNSPDNDFKQCVSRFFFNIDLIEQRVCNQPKSGLVLNYATGECEFDPELCTARSEEELVDSVRRLARRPKFGSAMLSTPAPDPDEKNEEVLSQWRTLSQQFDEAFNNTKENQSQKSTVKANVTNKRKQPFSKWALNDPTSHNSSSEPSSSSSATQSSSVVRPLYKNRKLWGLEFPSSTS